MTQLVVVGATCESEGHPAECAEPAPGSVVSSFPHGVTIGGTQIASVSSADVDFPEHAHDHSIIEGCHDLQSHTLDPDDGEYSSSLTINGSPIYIVGDAVATDPGSGGSVNILNSGGNSSVTESP